MAKNSGRGLRHVALYLCALLVVGLSAVGCGEVTPPTSPGSTPGGTGQSGAASADRAADQTFRINTASEPATIDPSLASRVNEIAHSRLLFASLLTFDEKLNAVPNVAESFSVSDDGTVYTYKLRANTTFSDGTPVKAQHFEYAWKRLLDPAVAADYASLGYIVKGAEAYNTADPKASADELKRLRDAVAVQAVDDTTLKFTLEHPAPYFPAITALWFSVPLREDVIQKSGDRWTEAGTLVGNGPFTLKDWQHQTKLVYEANTKYFKGQPKLGRIEAAMINDAQTAFSGYRSGELHLYGVGGEDLRAIQSDPQLSQEVLRGPGSCTFYLGFNTRRAPFDNSKVRQAFAQAIDREAYLKDIERGVGKAATSFIPPGLPGYQPDLKVHTFDKAKAKAVLAEAGFPDAKGLPPLTLTYGATARAKSRMEWVAAQLKDSLGVEPRLDPIESKAYSELIKKPETTPQLFFDSWCADYPDPQNWLSLVFQSKSTINHTGWSSSQFDQLTQQADRERDAAKRAQLYAQAQELLVREAPAVFLFAEEQMMLKKPAVRDLKLNPMDPVPTLAGIFDIEKIWLAKE